MRALDHIIDVVKGKHPMSSKRSPHWPTIRKMYLESNPLCECCGGSDSLQVHHKMPFHLDPELELDKNNLITLCEGSTNCHLLFGHLKNFKSYNKNVLDDVLTWNKKIKERP